MINKLNKKFKKIKLLLIYKMQIKQQLLYYFNYLDT